MLAAAPAATAATSLPPPPPCLVVMGVCGSGKSTVGAAVAAALGARFVDADALHPASNRAKMAAGVPLTDGDRWPWLALVAAELARGNAVVACSALKRAYRDALRAAAPRVRFAHLRGARAMLAARMAARGAHYMPVALLDSQLATLEALAADERGAVYDIAAPADEVVAAVLADAGGAGGGSSAGAASAELLAAGAAAP